MYTYIFTISYSMIKHHQDHVWKANELTVLFGLMYMSSTANPFWNLALSSLLQKSKQSNWRVKLATPLMDWWMQWWFWYAFSGTLLQPMRVMDSRKARTLYSYPHVKYRHSSSFIQYYLLPRWSTVSWKSSICYIATSTTNILILISARYNKISYSFLS